MAQDRKYICEFYISKHNCAKGRDAEFRGVCQTCKWYKPRHHAKPDLVDRRQKAIDKIQKREWKNYQ